MSTPSIQKTEEEKKKILEQYKWDHYYIGATIISGHDIVKIEMKFPPIEK